MLDASVHVVTCVKTACIRMSALPAHLRMSEGGQPNAVVHV